MTRYQDNENFLYQRYANLGKEINAYLKDESESSKNQKILELITKAGIWNLLVTEQAEKKQLVWDDCFIAVRGIVSTCSSLEILSPIITNFCAIHLISKYCLETETKHYLPLLIKGSNVSLELNNCY